MRFLLYIQNQRQFSPKDIPSIRASVERLSTKDGIGDYHIKNIRVSNSEVQLDIFVLGNGSRQVQEEITKKVALHLEKVIGPLNEKINLSEGLAVGMDEGAIIEKVVKSFNQERYWEAQETAEVIWNKTNNPDEKEVVQGVILVGAALVHHQRDEDQVCLSMLKRALAKLQAFSRVSADKNPFFSIDIKSLIDSVQSLLIENKVKGIKLRLAAQ